MKTCMSLLRLPETHRFIKSHDTRMNLNRNSGHLITGRVLASVLAERRAPCPSELLHQPDRNDHSIFRQNSRLTRSCSTDGWAGDVDGGLGTGSLLQGLVETFEVGSVGASGARGR